ncbi:MAG: hypothetical protein F6J98_38920 [Moorea sp. SIO4G2]|nr:hypothetical protein [Moorena sp. SIO4G2]
MLTSLHPTPYTLLPTPCSLLPAPLIVAKPIHNFRTNHEKQLRNTNS